MGQRKMDMICQGILFDVICFNVIGLVKQVNVLCLVCLIQDR